MAASTPKQRRQQALAWKLRMVIGAKANIYPRESELPPHIAQQLKAIWSDLDWAEKIIKTQLKVDHETNTQSSLTNPSSSNLRTTQDR